MDPELLYRLHAAEDEYVNEYYDYNRNLTKYLRIMNEIRRTLNYDEVVKEVADNISQQIVDYLFSTYTLPGESYRVFKRELWASTYEAPSSKNTMDDDKIITNDECGICLEQLENNKLVCSPNVCEHGFHCKCIKLNRDKKCPSCRQPYTHLVLSTFNYKHKSTKFGKNRCSVHSDVCYLRGL